ncbi:hypothetical protein ACFWJD_40155 [Streptomyces hawaiiensis]|uniref:hypothetical protein n=1 Tax=Streptomyces hawaiiensis TaxID=67305 RepID=UPI00365EDFC7
MCRDRAPFFAEGATRGAPQALQAADRWHLWHNLGEAAEKCVYRHRGCLRPVPAPPDEPPQKTDPTTSSSWPTGHRFAERTRAKHATIHALLDAGHKRSVARQLGMTLNTVMRFSRATTPEEMFTGQWQSRATPLDAYKPYLDQPGRKAAPTPGNCGRSSASKATHAATTASATTSAGYCAASPSRSGHGRHPPVPSRVGSSRPRRPVRK